MIRKCLVCDTKDTKLYDTGDSTDEVAYHMSCRGTAFTFIIIIVIIIIITHAYHQRSDES